VIYSTHPPAFLNVARLDELVFVEREPERGTLALQHEPVRPDEDFRLLDELSAGERPRWTLVDAAWTPNPAPAASGANENLS
jgi:hypothetical protein